MASPDTGNFTLSQFLKHPMVLKVISRKRAAASLFQSTYGAGLGSVASIRRPGRSVSWDIFDNTYELAQPRAPYDRDWETLSTIGCFKN